MGPCHACNGPHLVKDCNESICNRCRPNLDNHTPAKCPRKRPTNRQQNQTFLTLTTAIGFNKMVRMTQMLNYQFPPVNWTTSPNYWKPQRTWLNMIKSHTNITKHTIIVLAVTTPVKHNPFKHKCKSCNTSVQVNDIMFKHVHLEHKVRTWR